MTKLASARGLTWLTLLLSVFFISACATGTPVVEETAGVEETIEIEPWDGDGLDIPLDGSSMAAWERSMARVEAHTSAGAYSSLDSSIKWLLMYDLPSQNDMSKLAKRLDGLTGKEIIEKVRWRLHPRKKPAAGGATEES